MGHFPAFLSLSVAKYGSRTGIFYSLLFSAVPTACWIDVVQIWAKCDTYNVSGFSFTSLFTASIASPWTSFFHPEDGGTTLLWNLCVNLRLYTTSQPGRSVSSIPIAKAWHPVYLLWNRNLVFKDFLLEIYLGWGGESFDNLTDLRRLCNIYWRVCLCLMKAFQWPRVLWLLFKYQA